MKHIKFISASVESDEKTLGVIDAIMNSINEYFKLFKFYDKVYDPKYLYEDYQSKFSEITE